MSKVRIIDRRSEKSIKGERDFLSILRHPFIVNMNCAFQDYENLYLVMDLLTGGDLRYHLCKIRRFSEDETKFFIACLLLGLEYIHNNNIIHRDIKPENLVCDDKGYIRITDFGVAKIRKEDNSSETSGTPGYMAPEVLMAKNHSFPVDFFAIGIMGYEFMMGQRPYIGKNRKEIKHLVLKKQAKIDEDDVPDGWGAESVDFINNCLKRKESKRLGYTHGVIELKNHPWFTDWDWDSLLNKQMLAPFVPKKSGNYDKKYCEGVEKVSETTLERYQSYLNKRNFKHIFDGYTYINTELIQNTESLTNITTGTKSNKPNIKTISSMNNKLALSNKPKNLDQEIIIEDNNEKNIIERKDDNDKENTNNINFNSMMSPNSNKTNLKTNITPQLNHLSFSTKDEKGKLNSPSNSTMRLNKDEGKKPKLNENSFLSLNNYLNYSKQKRIKYDGGGRNSFYKKEEEYNSNNKDNGNGNRTNLSGQDPSTSLYNNNNNFKKLKTRTEEKKGRSSSACYSYNNYNSNNKNSNLSHNKKGIMNKINSINKSGRTLDLNKINILYNLVNTTNKGSLSGKSMNKPKHINFKDNNLSFGTPLGSPKNAKKGNLNLNLNLKKDYNLGNKTNRINPFYLPNLLKGGTLSPSFMNGHGFKLKGKFNFNGGNYKLKFNKNIKQYIGINYKKLYNENNNSFNKKQTGFKRSSSTSMFNQFMNNNNIIMNRALSPTNDKKSSNFKRFINGKSNIQRKKLQNNSSAINCQ